ncbi:hypothetical protein KQI82_08725 [Oscillibacter sp. MSJ-2]|uniref:DUF4178 domain-containing protein n=1 Tax=Dysosmobacter acutus TaxID=2841504 RepID=A0ABS6F9L3_9FIRM|nr:hypothetical protein [Dysosmobacter acutus]MBU5626988.1 hypothetical protein [Dysosmobacter acutus]
METYPLYLDGTLLGKLICRRDGLYLTFEVYCFRPDNGLYRAYAVGERGELTLGVMEPRGEDLYLARRLSCREAEAAGPLRCCEARAVLPRAEEGWRPLEHPEDFFRSGFFKGQLRDVEGALWRERDGGRQLALPFDSRRPFLLTELFCFARIRLLQGRQYAVFTFDRQDQPVIL